MANYWFGKDDELDAALILSGEVETDLPGRFCFQTTYLNECYHEYFEHDGDYRMVWVLRNPFSVVYSLMYNWRRWTLNELFRACGEDLLEGRFIERYRRFGLLGVPRIIRACMAYNGKVSQLFELKSHMERHKLMVVEYDELVNDPHQQLPRIYQHIDLDYQDRYCMQIHKRSTGKKNQLTEKEQDLVLRLCLPIYERAKSIVD